jgi:hypothetical protein
MFSRTDSQLLRTFPVSYTNYSRPSQKKNNSMLDPPWDTFLSKMDKTEKCKRLVFKYLSMASREFVGMPNLSYEKSCLQFEHGDDC